MSTMQSLFWLEAPYDTFRYIDRAGKLDLISPGTAVVWFITPTGVQSDELEWVASRPRGVSLAVILPPANEIGLIAPFLYQIGDLHPNAVLPMGGLTTPRHVRSALSGLPRNLPFAVASYLWRHRLVTNVKARSEITRIFELAPRTSTINRLCRDLYLSRRTLGRHFESCALPVPSHWLQFARLLHVVLRAQSERLAVFKIALSAGYPDGFTLSNQLKRMTGFRPSEIRGFVGFEWLVDSWLDLERQRRGNSTGSTND